MKALNDIVIAPMLRGLFLSATGVPARLRLVENGKSKSSARRLSIALPDSVAAEGGNLDEERTASELKRRFIRACCKGADAVSANDLPGFIEVSFGGESLFFEASHAAAPSGLAAENSALGRSSVVAGKVALVTGGAQGFGAEIVRGLAASGAFVYIADLNYEGAQRLSSELAESGISDSTIPISVNVTEENSVAAMFETVSRTTGGLDLLVSNAGVLKAGSVLDQDEKSFRFVTDVNYTGFFFMAKHCGRLFRRQWRTAPAWMTDIIQINSKVRPPGLQQERGLRRIQVRLARPRAEFRPRIRPVQHQGERRLPGQFFSTALSGPTRKTVSLCSISIPGRCPARKPSGT